MRFLDIRLLLDKEVERQAWDAILNVRADRTLVSALNEIYQLELESFSYSAGSQTLKALFRDRPFALNIDDLGAGIRIALRMLMQLVMAGGSAVLIEEVDGYQHVESYRRFAEALCRVSEDEEVQLFIATHSLEAVRTFVELACKRGDLGVRVLQTRLSASGEFEAAGLDAEESLSLLEGGFDLRRTS